MGSSYWQMVVSVRDQFCAHWPEGLVRRKEGEMKRCGTVPDAFRSVLRVVILFPSSLTAVFPLVNFKGELG